MKFNKKSIFIFFLATTYYTMHLNACVITLTNDLVKEKEVVQIEPKGEESFILQPNQTKKFGKENEHADFYLSMKTKEGTFKQKYEVIQTVCPSHLEATTFNVSAIVEGKLDTGFFKIKNLNGDQSNHLKHDMYDSHDDMGD